MSGPAEPVQYGKWLPGWREPDNAGSSRRPLGASGTSSPETSGKIIRLALIQHQTLTNSKDHQDFASVHHQNELHQVSPNSLARWYPFAYFQNSFFSGNKIILYMWMTRAPNTYFVKEGKLVQSSIPPSLCQWDVFQSSCSLFLKKKSPHNIFFSKSYSH